MMRSIATFGGVAFVATLALACTDDKPADENGESSTGETGDTDGEPQWPTVDLDALPYEYLSEYGFFVGDDLSALAPAQGVYPYTVVSPLFSDFAGKARFLYMPEGEQLHIDWAAADPGPGGEGELWDWPVGSVLIKSFYFDVDRQDPGSPTPTGSRPRRSTRSRRSSSAAAATRATTRSRPWVRSRSR